MTDPNAAIALQFYKAFDDRAIDQALNLLGPNFVAHLAGAPNPLNAKEFEAFGMAFYLAFQQGQHNFDQVLVAGDRVVTCGTFVATHVAPFQGLPATDKQIHLAIMHIDLIQDGKIVEHWGQGDALGLMQQLGVIFLPGPKLLPDILRGVVSKVFRPKSSQNS